jgi:hypothetical protein
MLYTLYARKLPAIAMSGLITDLYEAQMTFRIYFMNIKKVFNDSNDWRINNRKIPVYKNIDIA